MSKSCRAARGEPRKYLEDAVLAYTGDDCLVWPFYRSKQGYARIWAPMGETVLVARLVCERIHGAPPTMEYQAAHSCGRGHEGCISPSHLRWATPLENSSDKVKHGTAKIKAKGEKHPGRKLSESDVRRIRALRGVHPRSSLSQMFQVKPETIKAVHTGRTWAWLS